jgi:hypothetical protein
MPFWKFGVNIDTGREVVSTVGEFRRSVLRTLYRGQDGPGRPLYFYVPAFRVKSVDAANRVASRITRVQPELQLTNPLEYVRGRFAGAFVSATDAAEMLWIIYLSLVPVDGAAVRKVEDGRIRINSARLTYLPFYEERMYLREPNTGATVHRSAGK